jgi:hypothetical protein
LTPRRAESSSSSNDSREPQPGAGWDESSETGPAAAVRCAAWAREEGVDPIGTAGTFNGYLLVEWPLPWPPDLSEIPELAPLVARLRGTNIRLQGLVSDAPPGPDRHAILYRRPAAAGDHPAIGGFNGFVRREVTAPLAGLVRAALGLLDASPEERDGVDGQDQRDVLICGHGRRDRCCGTLGTKLALELASDAAFGALNVRVWRTSHTGGHRFAPTLIVLPEATVWGFADRQLALRIVQRDGTAADLLDHYRGCSGLPSPPVQALERAVMAQVGWSLLSFARQGTSGPDGEVRLVVAGPRGTTTWRANARMGRQMPVPVCGAALGEATKSEPEWILSGVEVESALM